MLDEYMDKQYIAYRIFKNGIEKDKLSHAYLIETNGYSKKKEIALAFAKTLLCPYHYTNNDKCNNCHQCENIEKNCFSEIKIISPDGLWIKKNQIDELKLEFSMTSLESDKKVYILQQAEKLNTSAANTLLKFLEEPEKGVIAILLTDNIYQMLDTIVSRCQIVTLHKDTIQNQSFEEKIKMYTQLPETYIDNIKETVNNIVNFIVSFEKYGNDTITKTNKLWHDIIKSREEIIFALDIMMLYYKDIMNKKINRNLLIFSNDENMTLVDENNSIENINKKIQIILQTKEKAKLNANANLLIDKLIIDLKRGNNDGQDSRSSFK